MFKTYTNVDPMTKLHRKILMLGLSFFVTSSAQASLNNPNTVLIGEEAGGMGGAYTALSGDPSAASFYNPAALSRMPGNTLSAAVNAYQKYDTKFGNLDGYDQAPLRVNRGSILPIPASSGTVYTFRNFAFGLSIVFPHFDQYAGEIKSTSQATSYLNLRDESLWVGGSLALNLDQKNSAGLTMYYTSRTFNRSVTDQTTSGGVSTLTTEEKSFTQNSIVYILGFQHQLSDRISLGTSLRLPSLPVSGRGTYYFAEVSSGGGPITPTVATGLEANTKLPMRWNLGLAYQFAKAWKLSFDLHHYFAEEYEDLNYSAAQDHIRGRSMTNFSLGGEYYIRSWLALRTGLFTNLSSNQKVPDQPTERTGDYMDMWGFATNLAIFTTRSTAVTLGGYYSGGKGYSVQRVGQNLEKLPKSQQLFSFLVGTSFYF